MKCLFLQVVASAVLSMSAEVKASRSRLEELLAKKEQADAERDLEEHEKTHGSTKEREEIHIQSTQPNSHHYQSNDIATFQLGQGEQHVDAEVGYNLKFLLVLTFGDSRDGHFPHGQILQSSFKNLSQTWQPLHGTKFPIQKWLSILEG